MYAGDDKNEEKASFKSILIETRRNQPNTPAEKKSHLELSQKLPSWQPTHRNSMRSRLGSTALPWGVLELRLFYAIACLAKTEGLFQA
jgi:hypothetical protein